MAKKAKKIKTRAEPQRRTVSYLCTQEAYDTLCTSGYTSLSQNPEIVACVDRIAKLVSSMTIQLMRNTDRGDVRERNELAKKIDVYPNSNMTRQTFVHWIVKTMLLEGNGNAVVVPKYGFRDGRYFLNNLIPAPPEVVAFIPDGLYNYKVFIEGREYDPNDVLHFLSNPDSFYPWLGDGYRVALKDVANNLKQALATEKGFMSSKWKPSIIVKIDALTEEFASPEGRARLLDEYINTNQAGEPWLIPAEQFDVQEIRPLSLSDLALSDMVQLDKKTVASILGVPPFVLGVGDFKKDEWNNFIATTIMPIAKGIEQELTKKILTSPDLYFRFNPRSLYNYSITEMVSAGAQMVDRMAMRRNEWRDWVGLPPDPDMDELLALENYIPQDRLGDQKKLIGGEED